MQIDDNTEEHHEPIVEPPDKERVDCERCEDVEVLVFVDRKEPALCDDCEEYIANLEVPYDGREITPMDKRWRW